jgi:hypothetical protein
MIDHVGVGGAYESSGVRAVGTGEWGQEHQLGHGIPACPSR